MKPTTDEVLKWIADIWGIDPAKPWHESALNHLQQLAALAYAAGLERAATRCDEIHDEYEGEDVQATWCAEAIRALGDDDD